ncbi:vitamin B12-binding protein [Ligilactobacillus ruminis]|uniref:Vitamin B12-binding protein n=1 Tax=Ligilactobacillus ruminis TaxID=1623 RepID=A0A8B2Z4K5_9LACO|nr:vitamin B12-binding protein [Ligilactobacillus ruminis]
MSKIGVLPVTGSRYLRADLKNWRFARNGGLHFTGRSQKLAFCP